MKLQRSLKLAVCASLAASSWLAGEAVAQTPAGFITSFEASGPTEVTNPTGYWTGTLEFQDNWTGSRTPRVQTADEISAELTAAGLNPANSVRTGNQALLAAKLDTTTESSGYISYNGIGGLSAVKNVIVDFWARPLTSGAGADPAGTPAGNMKTIGERQGNTFVGVSGTAADGARAAAVRFGVVTSGSDPYTNVVTRTIDFASASSTPWVASGLTWEADQWYNFKFDLDYNTKKYDFYVNGVKANAEPIRFYQEVSEAANYFFVSRGTNQAGQIIDDVSVTEKVALPPVPGDFNLDGFVDGNDFTLWQRDNSVGSLADWKANFGSGSGVPAVAAIPEPAGLALATLGLLAVSASRRRQRAV